VTTPIAHRAGLACAFIAALALFAPLAQAQQSNSGRVAKGYGPDADQTFAGEDPNGDSLPWRQPPPDVVAAAEKEKTPRAPDGHPDLTGFWGPAGWGYAVTDGKTSADGKSVEFRLGALPKQDAAREASLAARATDKNLPPYKPEYIAKVRELWAQQTKVDPAFFCAPKGFPRVGPPTEIAQVPQELVFLYDTVSGIEQNAFRIVSTDGRGHDPTLNPSFYGDSIGHWEGDTMIIDVTNFVDETWLTENGTIHSDALHIVERLTRKGNAIEWQITVEDPKMFTGPWNVHRTLILGLKGGHALEEAPCVEHDESHLVNNDRN